jgi:Transglutaminase-like superfamily
MRSLFRQLVDAPTSHTVARLGAAAKLGLVVEILRVYCVVRWRMRGQDIRVIVARLRGDGAAGTLTDQPHARRLGRAVARTLNLLPTDNRCLARSLVLDTLLTRRSLRSVVVLAARTEPDFAAHAWVEHDGVPVLPPGSPEYKRLIEL